MLRGIPDIIGSDLLKALADTGHGDLIAIVDHFYPPITKAPKAVSIQAKGGGLTFGRTRISDGRGRFTGATSASAITGTYAAAEAHAGAGRAGNAQVLTKGNVSLALAGSGEGWSLGVGFGKFVLTRN